MRPGRVEEVADSEVATRTANGLGYAAAQGGRLGGVVESWRAIICAEGTPWPCAWAMATVGCESSYDPSALATEVVRGRRYWFHGWFQLVSESPDPGLLADPVYNTERAAEKYRSGGVSHWPNCG